jgi:hypothetical protein
VLVGQESVLRLGGRQITNAAMIQVEGSTDVASGAVVSGGGIIALENGGHLSVEGTVASGQQIDFVDGTASMAVASGGDGLGNPWLHVGGRRGTH